MINIVHKDKTTHNFKKSFLFKLLSIYFVFYHKIIEQSNFSNYLIFNILSICFS